MDQILYWQYKKENILSVYAYRDGATKTCNNEARCYILIV